MSELKPISVRDLLEFSFYGDLKTCGSRILFIQAKADEKKNYIRDLMEYHPESGKITQLTHRGNIGTYQFRDENSVYFCLPEQSNENNKNQENKEEASTGTSLMLLPLDGGEAYQEDVLDLKGASIAAVLEDGKLLMSYSWKEEDEAFKEDADYEVLDESPWYFNGSGFIRHERNGLALYDPKTKALDKDLTGKLNVSAVSAFKNKIYFSGSEMKTVAALQESVFQLDLDTKKVTELTAKKKMSIFSVKACEKGVFIIGSENKRYGLNENPYIYLLNPETGSFDGILGWDEAYGNTVGTDCAAVGGNSDFIDPYTSVLSFVSTIVDHNNLYTFDGSILHEVLEWQGTIHSFGYANETLYFIGAAENELQQLYRLEAGRPVVLSDFNELLKERYVAKVKPIIYLNYANEDQMGWVLYPKDFDPKKTYPGILDIHGGPKTVYGKVFYHEMQLWASEGYFVFFCNPFGADGQGNAYADLRGKYGTDDFKDLMNFTDAVLREVPNLDPNRLSVTGGSYGGFMTNWIIGHTDRFKAAVSQRSISNWISFYGTSDIGPEFTVDQQAAGLEHVSKLWEHSPLAYASQIVTPTLFIHSDEDYRCPLEQGMQMMQSILQKGVPTRMCLFHGENHDLSRTGQVKHRLRRLDEITRWMKKYNPVNHSINNEGKKEGNPQ
ncbi:alpha/beta hydrolase family protein [Ileibacterium valens]|uniref:alpha/beta hydrolase family protein n=1 Tax=Ileibacterium valens TaxID=1862668 RepID=UPI002354EE28|nr:S9 family peptidase [Ileibacterium valens]